MTERKKFEMLLKGISPYYARNPEVIDKMSDYEVELTYEHKLMCAKMFYQNSIKNY